MAAQIGRPAVWSMSATRKSSQPEFSPEGADTSRRAVPLKISPAGAPVWRSRRSMRPWADNSKPPAVVPSKLSPMSMTLTSNCHGDGSSLVLPAAPVSD